MKTTIEVFAIPSGPTRVVEAKDYSLQDLTSKGWKVAASYVAAGTVAEREVLRPDHEDRPSYDKHEKIAKLGAVRFFILTRDEACELAAYSDRTEKAEAAKATAEKAAKTATDALAKSAAELVKVTEEKRGLIARVDAYAESCSRLERDMGKLRRELGETRMREVLGTEVVT